VNEATRLCADCGSDISARHWRSKRCEACQFDRERGAMNAKAPTMYDRTCKLCGEAFGTPNKRTRFCSLTCSGKGGHPGNVTHDCTVCGTTFTISRQFDRSECSKPCLAWRKQHPVEQPRTTCLWCETSFPSGSALDKTWCNDRCWHAWDAGIPWERIRDRHCVVCDEPIPVTVHLYRKVCSDLCATRNRSIEVLFRQTHARRKRLDEASLTYRVPERVIYALRRLPCIYCGGQGGTVDHVIPLARGGHHAEGNLVPACRSCNTSKAGRLLAEWRYLPPHRSRAPRRLPWLTSPGYLRSLRPTG
jgi:5-methylcytosine-specific restriction endonuclease McrA